MDRILLKERGNKVRTAGFYPFLALLCTSTDWRISIGKDNSGLRRIYNREFKVEVVKLMTEKGYSIPDAAKSLGIGQTILSNWKKTFEKEGDQAFPGHCYLPPLEAELRRLQAENSGPESFIQGSGGLVHG